MVLACASNHFLLQHHTCAAPGRWLWRTARVERAALGRLRCKQDTTSVRPLEVLHCKPDTVVVVVLLLPIAAAHCCCSCPAAAPHCCYRCSCCLDRQAGCRDSPRHPGTTLRVRGLTKMALQIWPFRGVPK
jgi:hypothetical protein